MSLIGPHFNRKTVACPDFFKSGFTEALTRVCVFHWFLIPDRSESIAREAIRSVTHLVLAHRRGPSSAKPSLFEPKEQTAWGWPGSFRLGFWGIQIFAERVLKSSASAGRSHNVAPNSPLRRVPKTFSAEPCSFNVKKRWLASPHRRGALAYGLQPDEDSRRGRIASKPTCVASK